LWILNFSFLELLKFMLKNKTNPNYEVSPDNVINVRL